MPPARNALRQYGETGRADVGVASPARIIQMLMAGALEKIATAKGHLERGETAEKGVQIGWAFSIIAGLRESLDPQQGGEIAANLDSLYDYMGRRLTEANITNDAALLDEVSGLLRQLKSAWDALPEEATAA